MLAETRTDPDSPRIFAEEDLTLLRLLAAAAQPRLLGPEEAGPTGASAEGRDEALVVSTRDDLEESGVDAEVARVVCEAMSREVEPDALLGAALRAASGTLGAELASLYFLDPKADTLRLEAQWEGAGVGDRDHLPTNRGLTGASLATGHPVASNEAAADPRFDADADTDAEGGRAPCLILPLRFRGKVLGVARLFGSDPRLASPRVAEVLGAALSAAVRNVFLYRSLVDSIEELADARRATPG